MGFNYYDLNHSDFLHFMLIRLISTEANKMDLFDLLAEKTNTWSNVELTIQINGQPVSVKAFVEGLERDMHYFAKKAGEQKAYEIIEDLRDRTNRIHDLLEEVEENLKTKLEEIEW